MAEELGEVGALRVEITACLDTDGVELTLEDTADAIDFAGGEVAHEGQDGGSVAGDEELAVRLVSVGGYLCDFGVGCNACGYSDLGLLGHFVA